MDYGLLAYEFMAGLIKLPNLTKVGWPDASAGMTLATLANVT